MMQGKSSRKMVSVHHGSDDLSHSAEHDENGSSKGETEDSANREEELITDRKSKAVNRLRGCVILALIMASFGVSITVFVLTRKADTEAFEIQYDGNVDKIHSAFESIFAEVAAISALAADATVHSQDHNSTWPFHTLSNFHGRGGNARELSGALYVSLSHIVSQQELQMWEEYVLSDANQWIDQGHAFQQKLGVDGFEDPGNVQRLSLTSNKVDPLHYFDAMTGLPVTNIGNGPYLATWQTSPCLRTGKMNVDRFHEASASEICQQSILGKSALFSDFVSAPAGNISSSDILTSFFATLLSTKEGKEVNYLGDPMTYLAVPVFDSFEMETRQVVAVAEAVFHWKAYFENILPPKVEGIRVVLENGCSGSFTYEIQGKDVFGVGVGDLHEDDFTKYRRHKAIELDFVEDGMNSAIPWDPDACPYSISVYPSWNYYRYFISGDSINVTFAVGMIFFYSILLFIFYDRLVESRQRILLAKATKSTAIVASLFPKNVRDRLLEVEEEKPKTGLFSAIAPSQRVKTFLGGDTEEVDGVDSQPIADLFPDCTVMFADIAGFTAWSSTREPAQVFVLLQSVYQAFDILAKKQRVFKVETIGDSYVAVTGLPEPQTNHAVIMAKFAGSCLTRLADVLRELEVSLGPDTSSLGMRFGLHSGPVTAGVLKGDRARFQLFGDTVNTCARMESTGVRNRIQISAVTANLLTQAGKSHWVQPRKDGVHAKGKGVLSTFWLDPTSKGADVSGSSNGSETGAKSSSEQALIGMDNDISQQNRLVDWMVDLLVGDIKKILAVRMATNPEVETNTTEDICYIPPDGVICLDEARKAMNMHKFDARTANAMHRSQQVQVQADVVELLREYVGIIASSYNDNPFHNFAHACHVTMSVHKLLSRIVAPDLSSRRNKSIVQTGGDDLAKELNDFSHGIIHDPMALFAITFAALIHDVDHQGVSNVQLGKERPHLASRYRNKSVAEQFSIDIAWGLLMEKRFKKLRKCIFGGEDEVLRFRQLIVNAVLATDIFDKELNDLRKARWEQAFSGKISDEVNDLRATIVIEHIIQASDVSHTMQHWHVYRKWNTRLFKEMYLAYLAGRMGSDPSTFWYQGELGFFDNYVIPLAKKLKECNVFGVSSQEYLDYALKNRAEWEDRGQEIVAELVAECSSLRSV